MKFRINIEVWCESTEPSFEDLVAYQDAPMFEFENLKGMTAYLTRLNNALPAPDKFMEFIDAVRLEARAIEKTLKKWDSRNYETLRSEIDRAIKMAVQRSSQQENSPATV